LKTVSLGDLEILKVIEDISNDLNLCESDEIRVQELCRRKAVPPPVMWDLVEVEIGRGKLNKEKLAGVASMISEEVELAVIQVSVRQKR